MLAFLPTKKSSAKIFWFTLALSVGAPLILSAAVTMPADFAPAAFAPLALPVLAQETHTPIDFTPQVIIPRSAVQGLTKVGEYNPQTGIMTSDLLAKYIKAFYDYGLAAAGILAAIVLMAGGLLWLTSGGNDTKIGQAKELIAGSITGSLILFSSWIILNTINPELLQLKTISTKVAPTLYMNIGCCKSNTDSTAFGGAQSDCGAGHTFFANQMYDPASKSCAAAGCCIVSITPARKNSKIECSQSTQSGCQAPSVLTGTALWSLINKEPLPPSAIFINQKCGAMSECAGAILGCEDKADGTECSSTGDGYCYDKACLIGTTGTKVGDQCGTDKGAICQKNYYNPRSVVPRCPNSGEVDSRNWLGSSDGRDCDSGLICCRPERVTSCSWATNNQCADIDRINGPETSCSGTKPNADTAKCCCATE